MNDRSTPHLPSTHRVIEITTPGKPEVLKVCTRELPTPKSGEVLIQVAAAGVNRPDVLQRLGKYPLPPGASDLPGLELAGTVARLGEGVAEWKVGDRVCALTPGGAYAEYCIVPASNCLPIPIGLDFVQAASLPETVLHGVEQRLRPRRAKARGDLPGAGRLKWHRRGRDPDGARDGKPRLRDRRSAKKCAACEQLGAERAINYRTEDFVEAVQALTGGKGVDVVLDMVAGEYVPREMKALAEDGRIVIIATLGGSKAAVDLMEVLRRRLTLTGSTLRPRSVEFKAEIARALREKVWPLVEAGRMSPIIYATFPLEHAAKAHALMESGEHIGKIVLTVQ